MDLGGIALVILIVVLGLGLAAGTLVWIMGSKGEQEQANQEQVWPAGYVEGDELPPREDAWKPAIWYSEAAKGTLFPNQPSPSFRISADTAFQRAIAQRDLEAKGADGPTEPNLPAARLATSPAVNQQELATWIPDEVENLSEIPTQTMQAIPIKDDLPPTLKMRSVTRSRTTYPLPEVVMEPVSSAMMGEQPEPEPTPVDSVPSVAGEEPTASPATEAYQEPAVPIWSGRVDTLPLSNSTSFSMLDEEVDTSEMAALEMPIWVEPVDTSQLVAPLPFAPMEEVDTSQVVAPPPLVPVEEVGRFQVVAPRNQLEEESLAVFAPDVQSEPEPERPDEREEVGGPLETNEERYERLMVEAYSQVIHAQYDEELDAVALSFSGCPIRQNSDVPWVFKTISRKILDLLAPQAWRQHAILLDVAKLQVAAEAQAAWEMMLDGFVAQSCPEVTPYAVLAIQYDSSSAPDETLEPGEATHDLQLASSVTGQLRPLIEAPSYETAVVLIQLLRTKR